jgi:uncharacterized membrane protein
MIRPAIALVIFVNVVMTVVIYPMMPDNVASHWNAAGNLDGTLPKFWGLILIPLLMCGFCALFVVLPASIPSG